MAGTQWDKGHQVGRQIMAKCWILFLNFTSSPPSVRFLTSFALHLYLCYTLIPLSSHPSLLKPVHPVSWNPAFPAQRWDPETGKPQGCSAPVSSMSCQLPPGLYPANCQEYPSLTSLPQQHLPCQHPQEDHHRSCSPASPSQDFWSSSEQLHTNFAVFK